MTNVHSFFLLTAWLPLLLLFNKCYALDPESAWSYIFDIPPGLDPGAYRAFTPENGAAPTGGSLHSSGGSFQYSSEYQEPHNPYEFPSDPNFPVHQNEGAEASSSTSQGFPLPAHRRQLENGDRGEGCQNSAGVDGPRLPVAPRQSPQASFTGSCDHRGSPNTNQEDDLVKVMESSIQTKLDEDTKKAMELSMKEESIQDEYLEHAMKISLKEQAEIDLRCAIEDSIKSKDSEIKEQKEEKEKNTQTGEDGDKVQNSQKILENKIEKMASSGSTEALTSKKNPLEAPMPKEVEIKPKLYTKAELEKLGEDEQVKIALENSLKDEDDLLQRVKEESLRTLKGKSIEKDPDFEKSGFKKLVQQKKMEKIDPNIGKNGSASRSETQGPEKDPTKSPNFIAKEKSLGKKPKIYKEDKPDGFWDEDMMSFVLESSRDSAYNEQLERAKKESLKNSSNQDNIEPLKDEKNPKTSESIQKTKNEEGRSNFGLFSQDLKPNPKVDSQPQPGEEKEKNNTKATKGIKKPNESEKNKVLLIKSEFEDLNEKSMMELEIEISLKKAELEQLSKVLEESSRALKKGANNLEAENVENIPDKSNLSSGVKFPDVPSSSDVIKQVASNSCSICIPSPNSRTNLPQEKKIPVKDSSNSNSSSQSIIKKKFGKVFKAIRFTKILRKGSKISRSFDESTSLSNIPVSDETHSSQLNQKLKAQTISSVRKNFTPSNNHNVLHPTFQKSNKNEFISSDKEINHENNFSSSNQQEGTGNKFISEKTKENFNALNNQIKKKKLTRKSPKKNDHPVYPHWDSV